MSIETGFSTGKSRKRRTRKSFNQKCKATHQQFFKPLKSQLKVTNLNFLMLETMGVEAQKDLGGRQTFARKMTLNFARKAIGFSVQIKVTSKNKKRSSLKLRRFDEY